MTDYLARRCGAMLESSNCGTYRAMRNHQPLRHAASLLRLASVFLAIFAVAPLADAQSLRGSKSSMQRQNLQARRHDFSFLDTRDDVASFVRRGLLVRLTGNANYHLKEVSFPYARPEVRTFVENLAAEYKKRCGEDMVVTSLVRPRRHQPRNASAISVHPTGMAFDLRRSWSRRCRGWLEGVFLTFEGRGILEATLERRPYHYHVALFPRPYREYLTGLGNRGHFEFEATSYRVDRGDTLWKIASRHNTSVEHVMRRNGLRSDRIYIGQVLQIPAAE